jgi:hypothetical protein
MAWNKFLNRRTPRHETRLSGNNLSMRKCQ